MKLQPGLAYTLKYTHQFCHTAGKDGYKDFSKGLNSEDRIEAVFIGEVSTRSGRRNVFYNDSSEKRAYIMFAADKVDYIELPWIKTSDRKPREGSNVEYSNDGITAEGTLDYKTDRRCMLAGIAGGHGYFSNAGFATDGANGEDRNLICDDPEYWRYYDEN